MARDPRFSECDAEAVFASIAKAPMTPEAQSLWDRLREELRAKKTPAAAMEYLRSSFAEIAQRVERELSRVRETL